jgi:hypothetical protein
VLVTAGPRARCSATGNGPAALTQRCPASARLPPVRQQFLEALVGVRRQWLEPAGYGINTGAGRYSGSVPRKLANVGQ